MNFIVRSLFFTSIIAVIIAIILSFFEHSTYVSLSKPNNLGDIRDRSPENSADYGRFTKPLEFIDYSWVSTSKLFNYFNQKHWHYKSIVTDQYFIVAAIANFNYVANAFVYVVDRTMKTNQIYQYEARSLFSSAIQNQASSSIHGCTKFFRSSKEFITLCYSSTEQKYFLIADVPMSDGHQITLDLEIQYSPETVSSMVLLYPVQTYRPAYTHKAAILEARGTIVISGKEKQIIKNGLANIDWTVGYPERQCRWKWVSLSTVGKNTISNETINIGINLSDNVYNDKNGVSMEAAVWIGKQIHNVGLITYELPKNSKSKPWKIYTSEESIVNNVQLKLTFTPWGTQEEHMNVFVLAGDFVQYFGVFNGVVDVAGDSYLIQNGFGVTENHYAKW